MFSEMLTSEEPREQTWEAEDEVKGLSQAPSLTGPQFPRLL